MGRWSETIMGGDTPLDIESRIYDICGIEMFPEEDLDSFKVLIPAAILVEKQDEIISDSEIADWDEDNEIFMILAVIMMRVGAPIRQDIKDRAIITAKKDSWAKDNAERKKHMNNFIKLLKAYDDKTPTDIEDEGLFDVIAKHLSEDKTGLVNKKK